MSYSSIIKMGYRIPYTKINNLFGILRDKKRINSLILSRIYEEIAKILEEMSFEGKANNLLYKFNIKKYYLLRLIFFQ